jgi:hypothetical protein
MPTRNIAIIMLKESDNSCDNRLPVMVSFILRILRILSMKRIWVTMPGLFPYYIRIFCIFSVHFLCIFCALIVLLSIENKQILYCKYT